MIEGIRPEDENARAKLEEETLNMGIVHTEELHDLDEDVFGEQINLATGKPFDNSTNDPSIFETEEIEDHGGIAKDVLHPIIEEEEDEAEKWLRENDPEYKPTDGIIFKNKKK